MQPVKDLTECVFGGVVVKKSSSICFPEPEQSVGGKSKPIDPKPASGSSSSLVSSACKHLCILGCRTVLDLT